MEQEDILQLSREEAIRLLKVVTLHLDTDTSYLSQRTEYARGYKDGLTYSREILKDNLQEVFDTFKQEREQQK